jgi:hypothetical protein
MMIDEIRAQYPAPMIAQESLNARGPTYCVGGALCLTFDPRGRVRFPDARYLSQVLVGANPTLTLHHAYEAAALIIAANDRGDFDRAWAYAALALTAQERTRA